MSSLFWPIIWSMAPLGELRVGLPLAIAQGVSPWLAYLVTVCANIVVFPFLMLFLEYIHYHFLHLPTYRTAFDMYMGRVREKHHVRAEKYGAYLIFLLVAIPLPMTGAYTATVVSWFFGLSKWKSFLAIIGGLMVSGLIMLALSVGWFSIF